MIPIKEQEILEQMDKIITHFQQNLNTSHLKKILMKADIPGYMWETLDRLDEKSAYRKLQGYSFDELYEIVLAAATLIFHVKKEIQPNLKTYLTAGSNPQDRVIQQMIINNFGSNLSIFNDMINEFYMKVVQLDKQMSRGGVPEFEKIPELKNIGQYLVDS